MIRKAVCKDASRIAEILVFAKRVAYRSIFNDDAYSFGVLQVLPLATELISCPEKLGNIWVYDDGITKAMAEIRLNSDALEIEQFFVDPFFQNKGIGGLMIGHIDLIAKEHGITLQYLQVLEKNTKARRFYEKHGFVSAGIREAVCGTNEFTIRFEKTVI
jgi:putative acetyltransferase